ncbi:hypothetical protein K469DRAFT_369246 [Zopfia rhizophila CBS 207.26]|uniref:Uncharacterized protein n=1 Tax=Zopfia rhizophila CBS 207.26 TaxID=1314779 RepID=A0A6A6EKA1_9PEZI|nr:hypothetical protein K469DRAFT_369246 [Zopfia rhizophila CBS 207.26]
MFRPPIGQLGKDSTCDTRPPTMEPRDLAFPVWTMKTTATELIDVYRFCRVVVGRG